MSRRAPRSRNTLKSPQLLICVLAAIAVVLGTAVPSGAATASVPTATTSVAKAALDPAAAGIAKTTLAGFNAGNIISDAVFTNKNTMTEAQIQAFFNSKVASCRAGYVCLKDFKITSVTRPADAYCSGYTGAANESAARIIYRVSQACDINPRVLIVMLQKEQSLITHTWPSPGRFNIALGQGCPDTAACDPNYIGFFHQIYGAARQMQIYMEGKWFQWYAPGKTWNILYHPNASCGSGRVTVANAATAALYYYTPYQPNAAALRAGYGDGNSCSAYGNRNFYNYFTDWFGSTQGTPAAVRPTLSSANTSSYVVGADAAGTVWGYPYAKGGWGNRVQMATGLGALRSFFGVGDLDGDGHRDFIALGAGSTPSLLRGNGSTTLTAPVALSGNWNGVTAVVPAGDFNRDGVPDVFTMDAAGTLYLRAGDDRGGFRAPVAIGSGWGTMSMLIGGVDMNGDGRTDMIARDPAGKLFLYPGNGTGGWGARVQIGNGWSSMSQIFSPGDFTGNGSVDLLAQNADGTLVAYEGRGTSLTKVGVVGSGWNSLVARGAAGAPAVLPRAIPAGFGNVDGVAGNDVVALTSAGDLRLYAGNGAGGWRTSSTLMKGWAATDTLITMGDVTGDGHRDLGRIDATGAFQLYRGTGSGFAEPTKIGSGWGGFSEVIGGIDFDGDRKLDVIGITASGSMLLYRGNGNGGWISPATPIGQGWGTMDLVVHVGDFDGDGRSELLARTADGKLMLYTLTGNGSFGAVKQLGAGWSSMADIAGPGDFNGDGAVDLLAIRQDGAMLLYPGNGKGGFGKTAQIGTGWQSIIALG